MAFLALGCGNTFCRDLGFVVRILVAFCVPLLNCQFCCFQRQMENIEIVRMLTAIEKCKPDLSILYLRLARGPTQNFINESVLKTYGQGPLWFLMNDKI